MSLQDFEKNFKQQKYDKAMEALNQLTKQMDPALFHYNKGLVFRAQEKLPLARFHLEKARDLGHNSKALQLNLSELKSELFVTQLEEPRSFEEQVVNYALKLDPISYASIMGIAFVLWLLTHKVFKLLRLKALLLLGLFAPALCGVYLNQNYTRVLVINEAPLRFAPSQAFRPEAEVPPGAIVILEDDTGEWQHIYYPSTLRGWTQELSYRSFKHSF